MSVIFFFMLFVLGVGSAVGLVSNITTNLKDAFPAIAQWKIAGACSVVGFVIGLLYITRGGLHILSLADYYGGTLLVFLLATLEIIGAFWIYGLENFSWDVEFMLKRRISCFWRISWAIIMPFFMISISIYLALKLESPKIDGKQEFPLYALAGGWTLFAIGCLQIFFWIFYVYFFDYRNCQINNLNISFLRFLVSKNEKWAPKDTEIREK